MLLDLNFEILNSLFPSVQCHHDGWILFSFTGRLYIADTNNSVIRVLDTRKDSVATLSTLELEGVEPPQVKLGKPRRLRRRSSSDAEMIKVDAVKATTGTFKIELSVPSGYHFSKVNK